jgi:hypothetical protein
MGASQTVNFMIEKPQTEIIGSSIGSSIIVGVIVVPVAIVGLIIGILLFSRHRKTANWNHQTKLI